MIVGYTSDPAKPEVAIDSFLFDIENEKVVKRQSVVGSGIRKRTR